jgi:threonine aldolase
MKFFSDNAASVHPKVWEALQRADAPDAAYDGDALSARLEAAFSETFQVECAALWVATGTAANSLALAALCPPHGGVLCHREAHIEVDEGGAPAFYTHGAKLILVDGEGAKLTREALAAAIDPIRPDVHQVQPHALSLTQATEYGRVYSPAEIAALAQFARERKLAVHVDGARFANAVAHLACDPLDACRGAAALSFGCVKNGGMNAEALVLFDPALADLVKYRRKRAGHLQSKGRFAAAQVLALLDGGLWLDNARTANAAAQELAAACGERLLHPVEANEVFVALSPAEAGALRAMGFDFYDWPVPAGGRGAARLVTSWNSGPGDVAALARAIRGL